MKHLILGTAGHVDHGKTSLIKALTGIDCDTHKEEKERGITINLGFAHLVLSSGDEVGIVDVPGHRDFVHTMVSGACGIDLALMVVAGDEGIMPQTREHLQIMQVLGIRRGLIAVTKADLIDGEMLELVESELRELTKGTFLENCPAVPVSSRTGQGLDKLREAIETVALGAADRPRGEVFRLFVDRIFSVKGFGTVVTGSVLSGVLGRESPAFLLPGGTQLRVRRLERHGREVDTVAAGDRASINFAGLDKADFRRGMLISDRRLRATELLDVKLTLFEHVGRVELWSQAMFLLGTFEAQARLHLIDRDRARGGDTALAQIMLAAPCIAQCNDRFVIRNTSCDRTLGGGEVIDAAPLHHRRRPPELVNTMRRIAEGRLGELVAVEVRKHPTGVTAAAIAETINASADETSEILLNHPPERTAVFRSGKNVWAISRERHDTLVAAAVRRITHFHQANPLEPQGLAVEELLGGLGLGRDGDSADFLRSMLERQEQDGILKRIGHTWALASHAVEPSPIFDKQIEIVDALLREAGMQAPVMAEIVTRAAGAGIDQRRLTQILRHLTRAGRAYEVEGTYLHAPLVDRCRTALVDALQKQPQGLTVAQFRDLVAGNRRICLLLYALFDTEGITERLGDVRVLTKRDTHA